MQINAISEHRRILLLQGPMSFFFKQFADWLESQGRYVRKINFNGGDWFFFRDNRAVDFVDHPSRFDAFIRAFLAVERIDAIFCFGDCRLFHRMARRAAFDMNIAFYVFEEGYVRPHYVTLEYGGVNGNSSLPKDPAFYRALPKPTTPKPLHSHKSVLKMCLYSFVYYYAGRCCRTRYPFYPHHKNGFASFKELIPWSLAYGRKIAYRCKDWFLERTIRRQKAAPYFVTILQVYNDSQVRYHSDYPSVAYFIKAVLTSFSRRADPKCHMYIKHHPMDLGHCHYGSLIRKLTRRFGLSGRVHYVREIHIPTLIKGSLGVVTINSTVGLSALYHGKPVKAMGRAIYDMEGLTFQGNLDEFWTANATVDKALCQRFIGYVVEKTQLNGSFLGRMYFLDDVLEPVPTEQGAHADGERSVLNAGLTGASLTKTKTARSAPSTGPLASFNSSR